ncbi:MAG: Uma2 family endonuclease, partial [Cyanobacteria bacterium Co-bin8]|nr:Uma2 family endonuclease [Cyanobacteria bacterium Co-bin8]
MDMGGEGINHASIGDLFIGFFFLWAMSHPEETYTSISRCQLEKPGVRAAAPDLVFYVGEEVPQWRRGESRYIKLDSARAPNLVGEISDTTLALDLDEKKKLYAALGIAEYWVINTQGKQVFFFQLQGDSSYEEFQTSQVFPGLSVDLLEQTLERLDSEPNTAAALWLSQQLQK